MLRGAGLRWRPLHEVQKHRPSRQARLSPELVHTPLGCGFGFWVSKSDARYCCGHTFSPIFAGLPECRFSVPAPESHRSVAVLALSKRGRRTVISHPAGHLVVAGFRATKKPAHKCVPTSHKKDRLIPCDGGFTFM